MDYEYAAQIVENIPSEKGDEDNYTPETMPVPLKEFLEFQIGYWLDNEAFCSYIVHESLYDKNHLPISTNYTHKELKTRVEHLMTIYTLLFYYEYSASGDDDIKKIKGLIFFNYFLCLIFILIVSLPSLYYASLWELWVPFSI